MPTPDRPIVRRSLFSWIFDGNTRWQVLLLVVIGVTVFARVLPLEMQKRIVNQAIGMRKLDLLVLYCAYYLGAVLVASGCKYLINVLETHMSQHALARMRNALLEHVLTLPLSFFRKTQPGTVVNAVVNELAVPATFVGSAVSSAAVRRATTATRRVPTPAMRLRAAATPRVPGSPTRPSR